MVEPSGEVQDLAPEEVFFSVTDDRGVITLANDVFSARCRIPADELVGASHNLVRHPMMPGGLFHLMWEQLERGNPFAGYFYNLAMDGSRYDVFATITPLPSGGYLAVRTKPQAPEVFATINTFYEAALELEHHLRFQGTPKAEAARRGAEHLEGLLSDDETIGDFVQVSQDLTIHEVTAREELVRLPVRPHETGPLADLLTESVSLYHSLTEWMAEMHQLSRVARALDDTGAVLQEWHAEMADTVKRVTNLPSVTEGASGMIEDLRRLIAQTAELSTALWDLKDIVTGMRLSAEAARFPIALARLQSEMTAVYVAEVIDSDRVAQDAPLSHRQAVVLLTEAVAAEVTTMSATVRAHEQAVQAASGTVQRTRGLIDEHLRMMEQWLDQASANGFPRPIAEELPKLITQRDRARRTRQTLQNLAAELFDQQPLQRMTTPMGHLTRIADLQQELGWSGA